MHRRGSTNGSDSLATEEGVDIDSQGRERVPGIYKVQCTWIAR